MLRSRELRRFAMLFSLMAAAVVTWGFAINTAAGILAVASAAAFGAAFCAFTKARYQRIARMSEQIDRVLHDADHLYMDEVDEGELSILHSEITKMTVRIREQNAALNQEKERLADSLADIAHQLRTPLTAANLILSLLANSPDANERNAWVRETEELLARMDWLITSLLKLSRLDAGIVVFQSQQVDVNELISVALRPFLIPMELHNIAWHIDVPNGMRLQGDPAWLAEAVQNILKNCLESIGDNGRITMVGTDNPLFTELAIRDSSAGFATEDLPGLFDRFYRGKHSAAAGYGIGLSLCKTIITRQGGTITADNHPQGGAVFVIRFPRPTFRL